MQASTHDLTRDSRTYGETTSFAQLLHRFRTAVGLSRLELANEVLCSENYLYWLELRDPRHRRSESMARQSTSDAMHLNDEQSESLLPARNQLERGAD